VTPVPYLIEEVGPDWVLQSEEMGGKAKFWYRPPGENETAWLFKFPRENTGEHWAEKVATTQRKALAGFIGRNQM
jgi:hypothetical protein